MSRNQFILVRPITLESIIGKSQAIRQLKKEDPQAAGNHPPVRGAGEGSTGKGLFALDIKLWPGRCPVGPIPEDLNEVMVSLGN